MLTPTVAKTAGFIPALWANKALDVLRANIVLAMLCARDTDFTPAVRGESITIPYPGRFTAQKKTSGSPATVSDPVGGNSVTINLDQHLYVDFVVEDLANAQANSDLMMRYIEPAIISIAEQFEGDLLGLYTLLSGALGSSGVNMTAALMQSGVKFLNDARAPQTDRFAIFSTKDHISLLNDSNLTNYFAFASPETVSQGQIGRLYGIDTYVSQLVKTVAGSPVTNKNIIGHKNAILFATRPFKDPVEGSGVQSETVVDQKSGLSIRSQCQYSMADRAHRVGFDLLYGLKALRPETGATVTTNGA